jgi:hypothetical protein
MPPKDDAPQPPANDLAGTPAPNAAVTQQPNDPAAATDDSVTLSRKDYAALLQQRDANGRKAGDADKLLQQLDETNAVVSSLAQKEAVRDAITKSDFKDNYPDVTESDILASNPSSPDDIEEIAKSLQTRFEQVRQQALKNVEVVEPPTISQADLSKQLTDLKGPNRPKDAFLQALRLKSTPIKN